MRNTIVEYMKRQKEKSLQKKKKIPNGFAENAQQRPRRSCSASILINAMRRGSRSIFVCRLIIMEYENIRVNTL